MVGDVLGLVDGDVLGEVLGDVLGLVEGDVVWVVVALVEPQSTLFSAKS